MKTKIHHMTVIESRRAGTTYKVFYKSGIQRTFKSMKDFTDSIWDFYQNAKREVVFSGEYEKSIKFYI